MKGPYGMELNDGCRTCKLKAADFFCQLPPAALKDFDAIKSTSAYPKGAFLFMERQDARGASHSLRRGSEALDQFERKARPSS